MCDFYFRILELENLKTGLFKGDYFTLKSTKNQIVRYESLYGIT